MLDGLDSRTNFATLVSPILPTCIDNLQHYMQCPHLLALWTFLAGDISSDPLVRWGLIEPEPNDLLQIACVFSGYHAIRREFKRKSEMFVNNVNSLTGAQLRVAWTVCADAFSAEAREVKLTCRPFSVASFLSCLYNSEFVAVQGDAMLPAPAAVQIAATDDT